MSVDVIYGAVVTVKETLEENVPAAEAKNRIVQHDQFNASKTLNSGTTPPVTKVAAFVVTLVGGVKTIDLTALTGTNGAVVDGTDLKVQVLKMKNLGANVMSITFGALTPYALAGADFKVTLAQNQEFTFFGNDATPDVAAGAKNLDLSGTTTQTAQIIIVLG